MITKNTKSIAKATQTPLLHDVVSRKTRQKKNSLEPVSKQWLRLRRADLMAKSSEAERVTFRTINALGYRVVRQYPINTGRRIYFADLYIPALKLILEVDGGYHFTTKQRRLDNNRSHGIWRKGYHVVRLSNHDARNPEKIKAKIRLILNKST